MQCENIWELIVRREVAEPVLLQIIKEYQQEMTRTGYTKCESERQIAKEIFLHTLNEEQKQELSELQHWRKQETEQTFVVGFQYGLYAGFKQYFVPEYSENLLEAVFERTLLAQPQGIQCHKLRHIQEEANQRSKAFADNLDMFSQEHLISIETAYDEQQYGVLRHAIMFGYRAAQEIICEIDTPSALLKIIKKAWKTENELGFSRNMFV
jgi:hypothetical protein